MILYHVSYSKGLTKLTPKIPYNINKLYEDGLTERVCFSNTIDGCLSAIQPVISDNHLYVYCTHTDDFYVPSDIEVFDARYTGEVWVKREIDINYLYSIQIIEERREDNLDSVCGPVKSIFKYKYKVVEEN